MANETKGGVKVIVQYWRGTTRYEGTATTYRGAMRIAARNRNAWPPRFYDEAGKRLVDTGYGLAYEDQSDPNVIRLVV